MENSGLLILLTISLVSLVHCSSLSSSLTLLEQHRIAKTLQQPPKDLASLYYAVTGLQAIGKSVHDKEAMCTFAVTNLKKDNAQSLMQFSFVAKILGCSGLPALSIADLINDGIEPVNFANLIIAMGNLGQKVDDAIVKKFVAVAKDNDAPSGAAASFLAASVLPASPDLKPIVSMVEDVVAQADEVNSEYLQFEGGLAVTSKVITGILALGDQQGQRLMKEDQAVKFAKYLVNRKYVHTLKDIHHLLVALGALSTNKQLVPVVVSVFRSSLITKENPALKVRVTNLIDQSIPEIKISATSVETSGADTTTILENKELTKSDDPDDFIVIDSEIAKGFVAAHSFKLDIMDANPTRGMYKCQLEVGLKPGNKLFALDGAFSVNAKVLAKIMVEDVEIGVGDRDQASVGKTSKLTFPEKLSAALEADYHQKIVMTFNLKDINNGQLVTAHQTFIRLVHESSGQEIFFVAEADSDDHYKFTLDVGTTGKDSFNNLSGKYKMALIVGDKAMQIPISWTLGEISLTFSGQPKKTKRQERITEPKPVIDHMFRIPEKRPPKIVSTAFTILVCSPLLIMFAMWAKIGANVSNIQLSIPTILFHVGLIGIFGLYYMFWVRFDMFYTLKLLVLIGGMTFLGGNKMLADMAAAKYKA
jgi:oligosaccharyltransferase complex subunit delta (ribophorin II)